MASLACSDQIKFKSVQFCIRGAKTWLFVCKDKVPQCWQGSETENDTFVCGRVYTLEEHLTCFPPKYYFYKYGTETSDLSELCKFCIWILFPLLQLLCAFIVGITLIGEQFGQTRVVCHRIKCKMSAEDKKFIECLKKPPFQRAEPVSKRAFLFFLPDA